MYVRIHICILRSYILFYMVTWEMRHITISLNFTIVYMKEYSHFLWRHCLPSHWCVIKHVEVNYCTFFQKQIQICFCLLVICSLVMCVSQKSINYKIIMNVKFTIKQGCSHHQHFISFYLLLVGWDLAEKWRGATGILRIHEGENGGKKFENHCSKFIRCCQGDFPKKF